MKRLIKLLKRIRLWPTRYANAQCYTWRWLWFRWQRRKILSPFDVLRLHSEMLGPKLFHRASWKDPWLNLLEDEVKPLRSKHHQNRSKTKLKT